MNRRRPLAPGWVRLLIGGAALVAPACESGSENSAPGSGLPGDVSATVEPSALGTGSAQLAASAEPSAQAPPLSLSIERGSVQAGRTSDAKHWVDGFNYSLPPNATAWLSFVEARDACRAQGLDLCSLQQLDLVCAGEPKVGELATWTTNYKPDGTVWTHGGEGCSRKQAVAPDDQSPGRGGLCCERRPAIVLNSLRKGDPGAKAASIYMSMVEKAMNSRLPEDVLALAADSFYLYSMKKFRTQADAGKAMRYDLSNGTEFDTRLVACSANVTEAGKHGEFECEAVTTRKLNTKQFRDLGMLSLSFRFIPPKLKYDTWAVGTKIVRNFTSIE